MSPVKSNSRFELFEQLASRYIWWENSAQAARRPDRVIAQVMNIGDYDDVQRLAQEIGDKYLCNVLRQAEPGQFNARSWAYWHYRLGLAKPGAVPARPQRIFR